MENSRTARMASAPMSRGRRRNRSTQAPANNPTRSTARLADTTSSAISNGPAPSTSSATSGTAVRVTTDPSSDTVWPAQSFMKSAWRQSDPVTTAAERTGATSGAEYPARRATSGAPLRRWCTSWPYTSVNGVGHAWARHRQHRLHARLHEPGHAHDARLGVLLRRAGRPQERAGDHDPELRLHGLDDRDLVRGGLLAVLLRR